jgi:hypothetical protein
MKSNFKEWNLDKIEEAFGLKQVWQSDILDELINHTHQLDEMEKNFVTKLQRHFSFGGDDWNEVELENKFISPMIVLSEIADEKCSYFLERELSTTIDDYELLGKVDGMIATGFRSPKKPYFCLNEYKRGTDPDGDPKGQALIAMLVAQKLNNNNAPIFGCFVIGRIWQFMILQGNQYAISRDFSCVDDEVFDIFRILKGLRVQIEKYL